MKNQKLFLLVVTLGLSLSAYAQNSFSTSSFDLKSEGVLYITETDSVVGTISYSELSSGHVLVADASGKNKKYSAKESIRFKTVNPLRIYLSVKSDGLDKSMMFYEDITPGGGKKLKLVKAFIQDGLLVTGGTVKGEWEQQLYHPATKKLMGSSFKKIAEQLKDCPALADKIGKKEDGYYFGMLALPAQKETVYNNILKDYNNCQ